MAEIRRFPQAGFHPGRENVARKLAPEDLFGAAAGVYCVYNQTRESFVATGVEAVDASSGAAELRLRSFTPSHGAGLWLYPCKEIAAVGIRVPLDLVYLGEDGMVLAIIESFPLGSSGVAWAMGRSVLALPESTVAESGVRVGHQLLVSTPDALREHFDHRKAEVEEAPQRVRPAGESPAAAAEARSEPLPAVEAVAASAAVPVEVGTPQARPSAEAAIVDAAAAVADAPAAPQREETPQPVHAASQPWKPSADTRNWWQRLLRRAPADPRTAPRESLPGLIAYFFTGGTPVAHAVRDISPTGMFIVTGERWYPGTVVRVTLTDRHNATVERSITVNAKAVRWGTDGVGLEFVFEQNTGRKDLPLDRMERANGMNPGEIEEFLRLYKEKS